MENTLLKEMQLAASEHHPFCGDRFNQIVNEIDKNDVATLFRPDGVEGPPDQFTAFARQWVEGLAATFAVDQLAPDYRQRLSRQLAKNPALGEFVPGWCRRLLQGLDGVLSSAATITCAEHLQTVQTYAAACLQREAVRAAAAGTAKQAADDFRRALSNVEGEEDFQEFEAVETALRRLLENWAKNCAGESALFHELEFLRLFAEHVVPLYNGSDLFWYLLIEGSLAPALAAKLPAEANPLLADALDHLQTAASYFFVLAQLREEAATLLDRWDTPARGALGLLATTMLVRFDGRLDTGLRQRYLSGWARSTLRGEVAAGLAVLEAARPRLLEWLRGKFERIYADWVDENLGFLLRLRDEAAAIEETMQRLKGPFGDYGQELAVGVRGQNMALKTTSQLREVFDLALWTAATLRAIKPASAAFRRLLVANLGLDLAEEIWRKNLRLQAILLNSMEEIGFKPAYGAVAKALLNSLDPTARALRYSVLDYSLDPAVARQALAGVSDLTLADLNLLARRVAIDGKLYADASVTEASLGWFHEALLARLGEVHGAAWQAVFQQLDRTLRSAKEVDPALPRLAKLWQGFAAEVPRATACLNCQARAGQMAREIVEQVADKVPAFATLGAAALQMALREQERALRQTARWLHPASRMQLRDFSGWWSRALNSSPLVRPAGYHEAGLYATFRVLQTRLSLDEADRAFAALHESHKEWLQLTCTAATLGARPLPAEGPLWRRLLAEARPLPAAALPLADDLAKALAAAGKHKDAVAKPLATFLKAYAATGDEWAAWQRALPQLDAALEGQATIDLYKAWVAAGFSLTENGQGPKMAHWQGVVARGAELIGQLGLARKGAALFPDFARAFAADAAKHLPQGLSPRAPAGSWAELAGAVGLLLQELRANVAPLAFVNAGRHLLEVLLPAIEARAEVWQLPFRWFERYAAEGLDQAERHALFRWTTQMELIAGRLPELEPVAAGVFASADFVLAMRVEEERALRAALSAACLAWTLPAEGAPIGPGEALARAALGSDLPRLHPDGAAVEAARGLAGAPGVADVPGLAALLGRLADALTPVEWPAGAPLASAAVAAVGAAAGGHRAVERWQYLAVALPDPAEVEAGATVLAARGASQTGPAGVLAAWQLLSDQWKLGVEPDAGRRRLGQTVLAAVCLAPWDRGGRERFLSRAGTLLGVPGSLEAISDFAYPTIQATHPVWRRLVAEGPRLSLGARLVSGASSLGAQVANGLAQGEGGWLPVPGVLVGHALPPAKRYTGVLARLGFRLLDPAVAAPAFLTAAFADLAGPAQAGAVVGNPVLNAYRAVLSLAKGTEAGVAAAAVSELGGPSLALGGSAWKEVFERPLAPPPAAVGAILAAHADLAAQTAAAVAERLGQPALRAPLENALVGQFQVFWEALGRTGDPEAALAAVLPLVDEDLRAVETAVLVEAWTSAAEFGPALAGLPATALLHAAHAHAVPALAAAGLGRKLHQHLEAAVHQAVERRWDGLPENLRGGPDAAAAKLRARRELTLALARAGAAWRREPPTLAALNLGRHALAHLLPQAPVAAALAALWPALEETLMERLDPAEKVAWATTGEALRRLWAELEPASGLGRALHGARGLLLAERAADDRRRRTLAEGLLVAALTPDTAPTPGPALLARLLLSVGLIDGADTPAAAAEAFLAKLRDVAGGDLPLALGRRLADYPEWAALHGAAVASQGHPLPFGAALGGARALARALWLARTDPATGAVAPDTADAALSRWPAWASPDGPARQGALKAMEAAWAPGNTFEVPADALPKPEAKAAAPVAGGLRGFFGGRKAPAPAPGARAATIEPPGPLWPPLAGLLLRTGAADAALANPADEAAPRLLSLALLTRAAASAEALENGLPWLEGVGKVLAAQLGDGHAAAQAYAARLGQAQAALFAAYLTSREADLAPALTAAGVPAERARATVRLMALAACALRGPEAVAAALGGTWPAGGAPAEALRRVLPAPLHSALDEALRRLKVA